MLFNLLKSILEEGMIYGVLAMGVYITYRTLNFPDLSVDGTFPLGCCLTAAVIGAGGDPFLACVLAMLAGALAGCVTGLLHVRLRMTDLLSGIVTMTALWTVNLLVLRGSSLLAFYGKPTVFTLVPAALGRYRVPLVALALAVLVKLALDWFLGTRAGLLLRATGDNAQFVTALARDQGRMKILGLAIGNACAALAGSILAQQAESANVSIGTGLVVQALACVIIGSSVFGRLRFLRPTTRVLLGTVLYKAFLTTCMLVLPSTYLKALMAVLLTAAILADRVFRSKGGVRHAAGANAGH